MQPLNSRQRLLNAIALQETDRTPCCFMSFAALRKRLNDEWYTVAKAEADMGLDPMLFIPSRPRAERIDHPDLRGLPVRFHPEVRCREWKEKSMMGAEIIFKEYTTPAGKLSTRLRLTEDWPHGDNIPFIDDYQVPRHLKALVTGPDDLQSLRYLLQPPRPDDIAAYRKEAERAHRFIQETPALLAGGWGVGMDMANWLCGMQDLMALMIEQPDFVDELLQMIHEWNVQRMQVVLTAPVDLFIRRAWYEGCDFVTPRFFRRSILPRLKAEVDLAHTQGARFGYICSSGTAPMLDFYLEAGIDVLIGIDPVQGTHTNLPLMKEKLGKRICLWGGVSAAVTLERGTEEEVRAAVRQARQTLGPAGFILSPVDNVTIDEPQTWQNIQVFIDEWQKLDA
jgi:uroporphyrinogen-III decarboxylase